MSCYMHKEYKLPDGSTVTAYFDELGCAKITIQAMDAMFDILDSSVEVVRCKDCKYGEVDDADFPNQYFCNHQGLDWNEGNHYCSYGERADK